MKLLQLTEPLFQYICRLNRVARKAATVDYETVRSELIDLISQLEEKSKVEHRLAQQYQRIEPALIYFIDSIVAESRLHFAGEWHAKRLAFDRGELAGDQAFFILLDATMEERGDEAAERLAVFYTCLGLGFSGWLVGEPEMLRRKMDEIAPRIRDYIKSDDSSRICPAAYGHTNTTDLPLPIAPRVLGMAIVLLGLILVVAIANIRLYQLSSGELHRALEEIAAHDPGRSPSR